MSLIPFETVAYVVFVYIFFGVTATGVGLSKNEGWPKLHVFTVKVMINFGILLYSNYMLCLQQNLFVHLHCAFFLNINGENSPVVSVNMLPR